MSSNIDKNVVEDFGREWSRFDQKNVPFNELAQSFARYFKVFPWEALQEEARGFDLGCGSGRWAQFVAPRVSELHCMDPSKEALQIAKTTLAGWNNCKFHLASVDSIPLDDNSMDFGYSLGVLHHVPDTRAGIQNCVDKLKPGAPMLFYLYYAFDNRPLWFKMLWRISDFIRRSLSHSPYPVKYILSQIIAIIIYYPLASLSSIIERFDVDVANFPLAYYADKSFYTMRTDALDRFGTRLEQRFTRKQIEDMLTAAGLTDIKFSDQRPFWCVVGYKMPSQETSL